MKRISWDTHDRSSTLLRLDRNENNDCILKHFVNKYFISTLEPNDIFEYPNLKIAYKSVINKFDIAGEFLFFTNGAENAIRMILENYRNKNITVTDPTFKMTSIYSEIFDISINSIKYKFDGEFKINIEDIINSNSDIFYIATPDNPTGYLFNNDVIESLCDKNTSVIVDETYNSLNNIDIILKLVEKYKNLYFIGSFSKNFGAAGIRLGYIISSPLNIEVLRSKRPMYDINSIGCKYIKFVCDNYSEFEESKNRMIKSKKIMEKLFMDKGIQVIPNVHGNFIITNQTEQNLKYLDKICQYKIFNVSDMDFIRVTVTNEEIVQERFR